MNGREFLEKYAKENEIEPTTLRLQLYCDGHGHTGYHILVEDQEPIEIERDGWLAPPSLVLTYNILEDLELMEVLDLKEPRSWSEEPNWVKNYLKSGEIPPDW
ncbi:MAG: hypothetical protein ACFFDT_22905 [Candidatus Hodarchaeota archaeon]